MQEKQKIAYEVLQQEEICQPAQEIVTQDDDIQVQLPDSRLIVWEIKRPSLPGLPIPPNDINDLVYVDDAEDEKKDDNDVGISQKQWYIDELHKAMMGIDENEQPHQLLNRSEDFTTTSEPISWIPSPEVMSHDVVNFYDPPSDGNCLFNAFLYAAEHNNKISTLSITSSAELRVLLMDHLTTNRNEDVVDFLTWEELAMSQKSDTENQCRTLSKIKSGMMMPNDESEIKTSIITLEDYTDIMKINTPFECCWGGPLEINLLISLFAVNIVIYEDDESDPT